MSKEIMENITKSGLLPEINFNGHCLVNNNVSIPKNYKSKYFLITKSTIKTSKHRFYIK